MCLVPTLPPPTVDWGRVYAVFGMADRLCDDSWPSDEDQANVWTVPVLAGITCQAVIRAIKRSFLVIYPDCLDLISDPTVKRRKDANGDYTVGVKRSINADADLIGVTVQEMKRRRIVGVEPIEWLLLEFGLQLTCGNLHLDKGSITMFPSIVAPDNMVLGADWDPNMGCIIFEWYNQQKADLSQLRARRVLRQQRGC